MKRILTTAIAIILTACSPMGERSALQEIKKPTEWKVSTSQVQHGKASWYGVRCNGGTRTASGIHLKDYASTAAHKTLPMGTMVKVTNKSNGKSEIVKIIDRGPYKRGRVIDVTEGVARRLDFYEQGITNVKLEVLNK